MKRPYALVFLMTFLGLLAGWGAGAYLGNATLAHTVAEMPASPIIAHSKYDAKDQTLTMTIANPGGQPIEVLGKSLAIKPSQGDALELAYVAFEKPLVIPGFASETLVVTLKAKTDKAGKTVQPLMVGDVVATTLRYTYPTVPDLFEVTHLFVKPTASAKNTAAKNSAQSAK
jgi:hypothetical protein